MVLLFMIGRIQKLKKVSPIKNEYRSIQTSIIAWVTSKAIGKGIRQNQYSVLSSQIKQLNCLQRERNR